MWRPWRGEGDGRESNGLGSGLEIHGLGRIGLEGTGGNESVMRELG